MDRFDVIADEITATQFSFICPYCRIRHYHGNCLDYCSNRIEHRTSHCMQKPMELKIKIDETTKRDLSRCHKRKYRNYCLISHPPPALGSEG